VFCKSQNSTTSGNSGLLADLFAGGVPQSVGAVGVAAFAATNPLPMVTALGTPPGLIPTEQFSGPFQVK